MPVTLQQVCEKALALPCAPALLPRLNAVLANPDAGVDEIEAVLRVDPVLTSATIRLANSAFFASSHAAVENVGEAVMRLGLREVYRLAALALAGRWMTLAVDGYRWEPGDFFRASLVTAIAAEVLADETEGVHPRQAYTAGLVAEIGKLAVAYSCGESFAAIRERQRAAGCPWIEAEQAVLGFNHAIVGSTLLRQWKFPEPFASVAQHNPPGPDLPAEHRALAAHVHAAKYIASSLGPGQGEDGFLFALNEELLATHGLTAELLERTIVPVFERAEKILREKFSVGKISF
jgi:HD-like signal output (HDOD) protein